MNLLLIALLVFGSGTWVLGQGPNSTKALTIDAEVTTAEDGTTAITARSLRPLQQAVEALRHKYGWAVDYEDPPYRSESIKMGPHNKPMLVGGEFVAHIHEPATNTSVAEERSLQELVDQYNGQFPIRYRVLKLSDVRFDIAPATESILDTPIAIDQESRSLRGEIDAIMGSLSKTTGMPFVQGGLINNSMEQMNVSLHHSGPVPVRKLLDEVLNHAPDQKVWVLCYEPGDKGFAIGINSVQEWRTSPDGTVAVKGRLNPHFVATPR